MKTKKGSQEAFSKLLSRFLCMHLPHERNASENTMLAYRDAFLKYVLFLKNRHGIQAENISLAHINREYVLEFLSWLEEACHCSLSTRNSRLAALKSWVRYLQYYCVERMEEWQKVLAVKTTKKPKPVPRHFSPEGIKSLLSQPDKTQPEGMRHLAMLALMYDTGCRVQELIDLRIDSLRMNSSPCSIKIYGKGRKTRIVPVSDKVAEFIKQYLLAFGKEEADSSEPLFHNTRGEKLTRMGITYILKKYADMARGETPDSIPESVSCHQLRHSRAMHLLEEGVNMVWIRDLLGHESVQTTEIYARLGSKQKNEAIKKSSESMNLGLETESWKKDSDLLSWLKNLGKH